MSLLNNIFRGFRRSRSQAVNQHDKSVRWRAEPFKRSSYWIITDRFTVSKTTDKNRGVDLQRYENGNYFRTKEEAEAAASQVSDLVKFDLGSLRTHTKSA